MRTSHIWSVHLPLRGARSGSPQQEAAEISDAIGDVAEANSNCTFKPEASILSLMSSVFKQWRRILQDQTRCDNETLQTQSTLSPVTELNTRGE